MVLSDGSPSSGLRAEEGAIRGVLSSGLRAGESTPTAMLNLRGAVFTFLFVRLCSGLRAGRGRHGDKPFLKVDAYIMSLLCVR
eukprot:3196021-Amphidinium_carterae.1